jgi:hypothetical protein
MNRLHTELQRLYLADNIRSEHHDTACTDLDLMDGNGQVRAMVLEVAQEAGCDWISTLWQGIQEELELPAPAIAVSGSTGYQVWFSLAEPVPAALALDFLESLRPRFLGKVAPRHIGMKPVVDAAAPGQAVHAKLVPALQADTDRWSAFVAPGLASMFADEPWLDVQPGFDAQANLLSNVKSIQPADFRRAQEQLRPAAAHVVQNSGSGCVDTATGGHDQPDTKQANLHTGSDPQRFLLSVMNDSTAELHLRIEAAKALLPYF